MAATTPAVVDRGGTRSDIRRQSSGLGFGAEGLGFRVFRIEDRPDHFFAAWCRCRALQVHWIGLDGTLASFSCFVLNISDLSALQNISTGCTVRVCVSIHVHNRLYLYRYLKYCSGYIYI